MIAKISIVTKMEHLQECSRYLQGYQKLSLPEILKDHTVQGAILRYFQVAVESTMDIGELIISEKKLPKPQEGKDIFAGLAKHNIISLSIAERFSQAVKFRNLIVHEYSRINWELVYKHLQNDLADFQQFSQEIMRFLQDQDS